MMAMNSGFGHMQTDLQVRWGGSCVTHHTRIELGPAIRIISGSEVIDMDREYLNDDVSSKLEK